MRIPDARAVLGALQRGGGLLVLIWLGGAGCAAPENPPSASPAPPGSQLPHLAADAGGRPVLSWVEEAPPGHRLVYSVLGASGWEAPVTIASGNDWFVNWADFPSVEPLTKTLWAAHWLVKQPGGMYAYDIAVALSRDGGRSWSEPFRPHDDVSATEHGFVSIWPADLTDGSAGVGVLWLDGRHTLLDPSGPAPEEPRTTLRAARFDAAGRKLEETEVAERACDCCQTDVAATDAGVFAAYRDRTLEEVRDIGIARLGDGGWQKLGTIADDGWVIDGCPVNGPAIAAHAGDLVVAWYTEAGGARQVKATWRRSNGWAPAAVVDRGDTVLGRVDVAVLPGGDAAVTWLGDAADGRAQVKIARLARDGGVGDALSVGRTADTRPAGFPRLQVFGETLLVAWTTHQDGVPRVAAAQLPASALPGGRPGETETLSSAAAL